MKKYIYIVAITILFASCDKEVENVKLPETTPKLVVYSYISPVDTIVSVSVAMSVPIFNNTGGTPQDITDATVIISDENGKNAQLIYNSTIKLYTIPASDFPIVAGETYFLKVSANDKIVDASCTVPLNNNNSLQILSLDSNTNQYNEKEYTLRVKYKDTPNQKDYYRLCSVVKLINNNQGELFTTYEKMNFEFGNELIDDNDKDGQTFSFKLKYYYYENEFSSLIDCFKIYLLETDKEYYEFHNSMKNYQGENPFSEPVLIYSNMNGGYGVFGAYNPYELIIDF